MIFRNKWKERYFGLKKSIADALALQLLECEDTRTKITDEIMQSIILYGHPTHWFSCEVCKRWRPMDKIDVMKKPIVMATYANGKKETIGEYNFRYCNDDSRCMEGAKKKVFNYE